MSEVRVIGLDIAKSVFQLHGVDGALNAILQSAPERLSIAQFARQLTRQGEPRG